MKLVTMLVFVVLLLLFAFTFVLAKTPEEIEEREFAALLTKPVKHFEPYDPSTDPMLIRINKLLEFRDLLLKRAEQAIRNTETLENAIQKEVEETQTLIDLIKPSLQRIRSHIVNDPVDACL